MWTTNQDYNPVFLKALFGYWKDYIKCLGYIYLNKIYESLGIAWNPDNENVCYRKDDVITFGYIETAEDEYLISICKNN